MAFDSKLAQQIEGGGFVITAEYLPRCQTEAAAVEDAIGGLKGGPVAVNVADNHYGVAMSSLAASLALSRAGIEPVLQAVTRDRNRIALQGDLLGAAFLGIRNVVCLSGYHQALAVCPESANVFDIDSIQLLALVSQMNEGRLPDGSRIEGPFSMMAGAVANPYLKPLELNMIRLRKKVAAGARFIQTGAVFDVPAFREWLDAARREKIAESAAILAGVLPLSSADEAVRLRDTYTDVNIPQETIDRMKAAGDRDAQRREGMAICLEVATAIKSFPGLRGIHILSGGNEAAVPELIAGLRRE